jgi:hypothetical protein
LNSAITFAKDQVKYDTEMSNSKQDLEHYKHELVNKKEILKGVDSIEISMGSKVYNTPQKLDH